MNLITSPQIYLVGRQTVNETELARFLDYGGFPEWTTDAPNAAQTLVEIAGRLCYVSYKNPRPGGNQAYLDNILASGHGSVSEHAVWNFIITGVSRSLCYHPRTEILTIEGWKKVGDVNQSDVVLTKNPETGLCRWSSVLSQKTFYYSGDMHYIRSSQGLMPAVTPDHLMWVGKYDLRRARNLSAREIMDRFGEKVPASEVWGFRFAVDHEIDLENPKDPETITVGSHTYNAELFFEWLGWVMTDGGIMKTRNGCYIVQSKEGTSATIDSLVEKLFGARAGRGCCRGLNIWRVFDSDLKTFLVSRFGRLKKDRRLFWLFQFSRRLLSKFMSSAIAADGSVHKKNGHTVIYCGYRAMAKDFQVIAAMIGHSCYVRQVDRSGTKHSLGGIAVAWNRPEQVVSLHKKSASIITKKQQHIFHYDGFVHCPETEDGLVYVRDDGMAVWSGNTHELIRHRVGLSPSELSQRFVDCSDVAFVVPPAMIGWHDAWRQRLLAKIEDVCATHDPRVDLFLKWLHGRRVNLLEYEKLTEALSLEAPQDLSKTDRRKWARQAARSALPNCAETKIFITANARALRHFIELRGSRHADDEIRRLAHAMLGVMQAETPGLFGDYSVNNGEVETQWGKV